MEFFKIYGELDLGIIKSRYDIIREETFRRWEALGLLHGLDDITAQPLPMPRGILFYYDFLYIPRKKYKIVVMLK